MCAMLALMYFSFDQGCLKNFDCESYIAMVKHPTYDPSIPGHHAMRVLPSLLVRFLSGFGIAIDQSFKLLANTTFLILAGTLFYFLRRVNKQNNALPAIVGLTMLLLVPHHIMLYPLINSYQLNDILVYPLMLAILYFRLENKVLPIIAILIAGLFIRQNLFVLGFFTLLHFSIFQKQHRAYSIAAFFILVAGYYGLIHYYHAHAVMKMIMFPDKTHFLLTLYNNILASKVWTLVLPVIPFMIILWRELFRFYVKHLDLLLYSLAIVGQSILAYQAVGSNFERVALQGAWLGYLIIALLLAKKLSHYHTRASLLVFGYGIALLAIIPFGMEQGLQLRVISTCLFGGAWFLFAKK